MAGVDHRRLDIEEEALASSFFSLFEGRRNIGAMAS
jgi:hypothetical protein